MTAYRDQYASLFNDGQNVVVLGISNDPVPELASWLKDYTLSLHDALPIYRKSVV